MSKVRNNYIGTDYYTIYDRYTSLVYLTHVKSYNNLIIIGDKNMHLFRIADNESGYVLYVNANDPIIAAIGLMENGYSIIAHVTKL